MRIVIVHDTVFGNTAEIASAIARGAGALGEVSALSVREAADLDPTTLDLLIVGSPTRGFAPTPSISEFLGGLARVPRQAAAFDTRLDPESIEPAPLRWVINVGGYAADRIAASLRDKGYTLVEPKGDFMVEGTEGPLKAGELERAEAWGRSVADLAEAAIHSSRPG